MQNTPPPSNPDLIKIQVDDIELGMYMSHPDRPWLETPFLFQGFLLDNPDLINQVKRECRFIYVDNDKRVEIEKPETRTAEGPDHYETKTFVEVEFENAFNKHQETLESIKDVLKSVHEGKGINVTRVRQSVKSCVESIIENPNAMLWLSKLRNRDQYTAEHCLNVGILAIALGRHLGLDEDCLETVGLCGMLHDVGKMKLDQNILNKPDRLTKDEFEIIKAHCKLGKEILEEDINLPLEAIEVAFSHHERIDGTGYPRSMEAGSLNLYTRIVSIVDTYDAITTNRCYDNSRPATEAIKILFSFRDVHFDGWLVEQFIECLGIYPTGSLVELHSGECAVVIDSNKTSRLHPKVTIVLDENKKNRQPIIVDTRDYQLRPGERTIKQVLDENEFNIDLDSVFSHFRA
ncbi:MAG: HD-GYP domain-containing protein [Gammaproteobacteria bacterium]|nr:HD-GYP domain-containing protein [Gammaproteobacteria bacterium]